MLLPNLHRLQAGDSREWDFAFDWLWPCAKAAAEAKLHRSFPAHDVEDVAIEALEAMVDMIHAVAHVEDLKPLVVSIAHNKAVDRLRSHFARKHGGGKVEALESLPGEPAGPPDRGPMITLDAAELARLLQRLLREMDSRDRGILMDFYLHGLGYTEIAEKYGMAPGTTGVAKSRAIQKLRKLISGFPTLRKELEEFLR